MSTLDTAARTLLDGLDHPRVLAAMAPQQPDALLSALIRASREAQTVLTLMVADLEGRWAFLDDEALDDARDGRLHLVSVAGVVPRAIAPLVTPIHASLWEVDRMLADGTLAFDILVARMGTAPDGGLIHGAMVGYTASALTRAARIGVEEVAYPAVHAGSEGPDRARVDVLVPMPWQPPADAPPRIDSDTRAIAAHLAALIPDGATLQVGLGSLPAALLDALAGHHDLGLHSGLLPGHAQGLIASGAVTGTQKNRDPGLHIATGVLGGDPRGWGDALRLAPVSYTHDQAVLATVGALWAVNSAFEVDLEGTANAEFAGGLKVASGGGQLDFARAAHADVHGASVLALPSRARDGRPRIVPALTDPAHRTTPGELVDLVVTENGVADLRGLDATARAAALAAIAHPDDRAALGPGAVDA